MARVKRGPRARRRKNRVLKQAEGYFGRRKNCHKIAKLAVQKAMADQYAGRKQRRRDFRSLWITRINAAARSFGLSYSKLVPLLQKAEIRLNRKMLAHIAATDLKAFEQIISVAKSAA